MLTMRLKTPTSVAFRLLVDKKYILFDVCARQEPAQYVRDIMQYATIANILNVPNQLSFAYKSLTPELRFFIIPLVESTKTLEFILQLDEK